MHRSTLYILCLLFAGAALAQSTTRTATQAATRPTQPVRAEDLLRQMLRPTTRQTTPTLDPTTPHAIDQSTQTTVAPRSQPLSVIREGSYIFDRVGRLSRTADGQPQFVFDADGQAMQDPPVLIHPNLKLMVMENAVKFTQRPPRFRITGMITEYGNRNYVLIEKVSTVQELPEKPIAR